MEPTFELHKFLRNLNEGLVLFNKKYIAQFNLKVPTGVIQKVDHYRNEYFHYLKESPYKSNICYLLQHIDYQIWLYRLFRPTLSIENSYFYQLLVSMGIISEALVISILTHPLDEKSRKHAILYQIILRNSFQKNIELLEKLEILPSDISEKYQQIRTNIRNLVHLQNWEGRLYESLTSDIFQEKMNHFKSLLLNIKTSINLYHSSATLNHHFFKEDVDFEKDYLGWIKSYLKKGGYGFISSKELNRDIYFHTSNSSIPEDRLLESTKVRFSLKLGSKDLEADRVEFAS